MISFYAEKFQSMPSMTIVKDGSGAGSRIISSIPNLLRIFVGETLSVEGNELFMIETNIDDMNPEIFESVMESLFNEDAMDVYFSSIMMKKNRPATKISVLAEDKNREKLSKVLLTETSSFGVRFYSIDRMILDREIKKLKTSYGSVNIKNLHRPINTLNALCARIKIAWLKHILIIVMFHKLVIVATVI